MENEDKSSTKLAWEALTDYERKRYYIQADYIIENGFSDLDHETIARKIYENGNTNT